jgi:ribonuclease D
MLFKSLLSRFFPPKFTEEEVGFIDESPQHILVNDKKSFRKMLAVLSQANSCVMDIEADSMHHYLEKLSLIQISVGKNHWLIDPLCGLNLVPLWKCKALKNITFHACDYDIRLLARFHNFYPEHIYDTSIAAKLLGEKQTGLAALVEKYFEKKLDKKYQKYDWTKRPLPPDVCRYAMLDTVYLDAIKEIQCEELRKLGRMAWLEESCETLLKHSKKHQTEDLEIHKESWRLRGSNAFKPLELQLLRAAWNWRDKHAKKKDCASYRILNPYLMMDIVKAAAKIKGKITEHNLPKLPRNMKGTFLSAFLSELNEAAAAPPSQFPGPVLRKASPRTAINEDLRDKLRELRNEKAAQLKMDSGLIAKQNQLNILADALHGNWEEKFVAAELMNWQKEIWRKLVVKAVLPQTAQELRAWAKDRLKQMSEEEKAMESERLVLELSNRQVLQSGYIAAFYPIGNEPQINPFLEQLAAEGRLLLPKVLDNQKMEFILVQNFERDLQPGAFGIMEPKPDLQVFEEAISAFLVPGLVFGKDGSRIGHGAGYYDRFFAKQKGIPKLGIAYSAQIRATLPQNTMDMRMDEVVWIKNLLY